MPEYIPSQVWGIVGFIFMSLLITFGSWALKKGIENDEDTDKALGIVLFFVAVLFFVYSLWNFEVIA